MILFQPGNIPYINKQGETILDSVFRAGLWTENICGGTGICGKCRVKVLVGEFGEITNEEKTIFTENEIQEGYRLACKLIPKNYFRTCEILLEETPKQEEIGKTEENLSYINKSLENKQETDLSKTNREIYGIAIDLGTTNVEMVLLNIGEHCAVSRVIFQNPQVKYGADVVSRISYAMGGEENQKELCEVLQQEVRFQIEMLLENFNENGIVTVEKVVIAGNSAMMHFISNYSVASLARAPYKAIYKECRVLRKELFPGMRGEVVLLPNIESFVGADTVGVLTFLQQKVSREPALVVDIGTNGELAVCKDGKYYVTSTAAGPALEGAGISCGMRAEYGAILGVTIGENIEVRTVGDGEPKGICGSGLIEVVAALYDAGIVDKTGYFMDKEYALEKGYGKAIVECLEKGNQGNQFVLHESKTQKVVITQKDIREFQLAKAAICAGTKVLLAYCNMGEEEIHTCYVAGALGTHINSKAAQKVGLFPPTICEKTQSIGNAALLGGCKVLLNREALEQAVKIAGQAEHISLSQLEEFQAEYISCMNLGI